MSNTTLRLPLFGHPSLEQRRATIPLITTPVESAGLSNKQAEKVVTAVIRNWLGYLPEPIQVRVHGELAERLYHRVGFAEFPQGKRFADPALFYAQVARDRGLREDRAKMLSHTVLGAWSRHVTRPCSAPWPATCRSSSWLWSAPALTSTKAVDHPAGAEPATAAVHRSPRCRLWVAQDQEQLRRAQAPLLGRVARSSSTATTAN